MLLLLLLLLLVLLLLLLLLVLLLLLQQLLLREEMKGETFAASTFATASALGLLIVEGKLAAQSRPIGMQ